MASRPGSRASRASTPHGSRASRASTAERSGDHVAHVDEERPLEEDERPLGHGSEAEAENAGHGRPIAELDELGWRGGARRSSRRLTEGGAPSCCGASFAGCLRRELQQKQSDRRLLCRYPLGPDELRTVFAYNRHKAI